MAKFFHIAGFLFAFLLFVTLPFFAELEGLHETPPDPAGKHIGAVMFCLGIAAMYLAGAIYVATEHDSSRVGTQHAASTKRDV